MTKCGKAHVHMHTVYLTEQLHIQLLLTKLSKIYRKRVNTNVCYTHNYTCIHTMYMYYIIPSSNSLLSTYILRFSDFPSRFIS